jgi:hypothetical protein
MPRYRGLAGRLTFEDRLAQAAAARAARGSTYVSAETTQQSAPRPSHDRFHDIPLIADLRAVHEAAHFVAAVRQGFTVRSASIIAGEANVQWTSPRSTVGDLIGHMVVFACGRAAQHRYGAVGNVHDRGGNGDDARIEEIAQEIEASLGREYTRLISTVRDVAAELVATNWNDIRFIARARQARDCR